MIKLAVALKDIKKHLSKKAQERDDLIKKHFMNLIGGGMIGNYNYIGKCLNGLLQN